jgi:hypothetical protein
MYSRHIGSRCTASPLSSHVLVIVIFPLEARIPLQAISAVYTARHLQAVRHDVIFGSPMTSAVKATSTDIMWVRVEIGEVKKPSFEDFEVGRVLARDSLCASGN